MAALGAVEQRADDAVMQVDNFIDDGGPGFQHDGNQCRVSPRGFQIAQVLGGLCPPSRASFKSRFRCI
jgi:hypothetical protein